LVLCERSRRGAAAIEQAAETAARTDARLTVVAVAVIERADARCCDTRAGYWNQVVQELAADDLDQARSLVGDRTSATFKVLTADSVLDALALEAERSDADLVVVPSGRGVHPWIRARRARRLQRRAPGAVVVAPAGYALQVEGSSGRGAAQGAIDSERSPRTRAFPLDDGRTTDGAESSQRWL
jgi:nucleotide-binding universal stress UspA family protein